MARFLASNPFMSALDLDADAGRKTETLECVDDARVEVEDVDHALVRAHLELLARVFVDERAADHGQLGDLGWEWDGAGSARVGTAGGVDDLVRRLIQHTVVVCLEPDPNLLRHAVSPLPSSLLLDDFRGGAGAYGLAAFADGEPEAGLDRDGLTEGDIHLDVVTRHDHLDAFGQLDLARDVGGPHVELRALAGQERCVAPTLFLAQDVNLGLELSGALDGAGLCKHLAAYDVFTLEDADHDPDAVAGLALVHVPVEHLDSGGDRLGAVRVDADDLDFLVPLELAALDPSGRHGAATFDREHVLDRHQERLVDGAVGLGDVGVDSVHQLEDLGGPLRVPLERLERGDADDGDVVAQVLVLACQLTTV